MDRRNRTHRAFSESVRRVVALALTCAALAAMLACTTRPTHRTFGQPEEAVKALAEAAKQRNMDELLAIFGPDATELADSSDPETFRRNTEVFTVAVAERWQLVDEGADAKVLVIGNEEWPFPVPLVKDGSGWRFDTAAGKEEVIARRIGRNELAAIRICRTYVAAQRLYAWRGHDGKRAGLYATAFRSDPGRENGLYWPAERGRSRSPLGDLIAQAAAEGRPIESDRQPSSAFHGYYFRILTAQGPAAPGGARDYVINGEMSGGFALVAWPAQYDVTGIMTFLVNQDGTVHEKDLGPGTDAAARGLHHYDPDGSWASAQ